MLMLENEINIIVFYPYTITGFLTMLMLEIEKNIIVFYLRVLKLVYFRGIIHIPFLKLKSVPK
jgi:hypothetical protein